MNLKDHNIQFIDVWKYQMFFGRPEDPYENPFSFSVYVTSEGACL